MSRLPVVALFILLSLPALDARSEDLARGDLPPADQVEAALHAHLDVRIAESNLLAESASRKRWESGSYEFNVKAGSAQRENSVTGQRQKEWDVAIERPLRLPNKMLLDGDIGSESVHHAEYALGDARHEVARSLLHLWFNWMRERTQADLWQQQVSLLLQQVQLTEKRMRAGDAPKLELNQVQAFAAQAGVSLQQAQLSAQLAGSELARPFPELTLPAAPVMETPVAIDQALAYWEKRVMDDNHELAMVEAENRVQQLLAQRQRADRVPDPTVGLRYSSEKDGEEKVAGVYLSVPISFGVRGASAEVATQHAAATAAKVEATRRRLQGDVYAAYIKARDHFGVWQQAEAAKVSVQLNADLLARAYALGESSMTDLLNARRLALESALAASLAKLDANEARYRLLLDAHQLWVAPDHRD